MLEVGRWRRGGCVVGLRRGVGVWMSEEEGWVCGFVRRRGGSVVG